jgi:hypothetical protein
MTAPTILKYSLRNNPQIRYLSMRYRHTGQKFLTLDVSEELNDDNGIDTTAAIERRINRARIVYCDEHYGIDFENRATVSYTDPTDDPASSSVSCIGKAFPGLKHFMYAVDDYN